MLPLAVREDRNRDIVKKTIQIAAGVGGSVVAVALAATICFGGSGRFGVKAFGKKAPAAVPASNAVPASIRWTSFQEAMHEAKVTGKPVMVDFSATWCGYCKMLDRQTYADPRVIHALTGWIAARVDVDKQPELAEKYGATSLPSVLFFHSNGQPAAGFQGFVEPNDMLAVLPRALALVSKSTPHAPAHKPASQGQAS